MSDTSKHANKRNSADIARDRIFIERLYIWGYNQLEITQQLNDRIREEYESGLREREHAKKIAADLNDLAAFTRLEHEPLPNFYTLTRTQIQHDIKAVKEEWKRDVDLDFNEFVQKELRRLDYMENEYIRAWERSKRNRVIATKSDSDNPAKGKGDDGEEDAPPPGARVMRTRRVQRVEYRDGNAAFMQGAERVAADRRKFVLQFLNFDDGGGPWSGSGAGAEGRGSNEPTKLYAGFDLTKLERGGKPAPEPAEAAT